MVKFSDRQRRRECKKGFMNIFRKGGLKVIPAALLIILLYAFSAFAEEAERIAVLPFKIESSEPADHLKSGLQNMLAGRLADKGYYLISPEEINRQPLESISYFDTEEMIGLGKELDTDWIVWGSLTETGDRINLDIKAVNIINSARSFSIFMIEDNVEDLAGAMNRAAESVHSRISGIPIIEKIVVEGNKRIGDDAILAIIESKEGEPFDQERLDRDLRSIYRMSFFKDVEIQSEDGKEGKIVTFRVIETPYIVSIRFKGNKRKKDDKLFEEIGIKKYEALNRNEIKQSVNRLREVYMESGYYNIQISEEITELPNNEVDVTFVIDEGEKVYIRKIDFIGNEVFSDKKLRKNLITREKSFLSWITDAGVLDKKKLEYDVHMITTFYHNNGYIRVKVGEPEVNYDLEKGLEITFKIVEGDQYVVNDIRLEGDFIRSQEELMRYISFKKGRPFNREIINNDIENIKGIYANEGYAYADIGLFPEFKEEGNLVDIVLDIDKGKKVRFERINILGNEKTRDKVIRRELKIVEGDYFNGDNLTKSTENLKRTGFFEESEGVELKTRTGSADDLMVADIYVKERQAGSIQGGIGYGGYEKGFVFGQVSHSNFRGLGQAVQASVQLSSRRSAFNTSLTEPWLFDTRLSMSTALFKWETDYYDYTVEKTGGSIGVGFPLEKGDYLRGSIGYSYDQSEVTDVYSYAASIIRDMEGKYTTSSITLGISRDSRDEPISPRKGSVNGISFEYAGGPLLGGDVSFNKIVASSSWYLPMKWRTVFIISGQAGFVKRRKGGKLPLYEKFRIGGDDVRGYDYYSISPLDPQTYDELGGKRMWIYSLEYRVPLGKAQGVTAYTFFDIGNAFEDMDSWNKGVGESVGFGIRWLSPMGPINLGYGFKLRERPNDDSSGEFILRMGAGF